jgi:uncharacterized protein (DUF1684 family)
MRCCPTVSALLVLAGCASQMPPDPAFLADWERWRAQRLERLRAEDGWLTLVGLYWLEEGESTVGSAPEADVVLPAGLPARVGAITLRGREARFTPAPGVDLPATVLRDDAQPDYDVLRLGTVRFYLIERGGRFGIRVKDSESPARRRFTGLEYFPPDPSWNVEAKLIPAPHHLSFDTEAGVKEEYESPGYLEFERSGRTVRVEPVLEGGELFLVFRDATSGKSTYAASRFLYAPLPGADGRTRLDFNRAYNPPCVFTPYATCPLPTPQNRLTIAIEAGEKKYTGPGAH